MNIKWLIIAFATLYSPFTVVAAPPSHLLPSGEWQMITLPANPPADANTVEAVLGDDLAPEIYGEKWMLHAFDTQTNQYAELALESPLEQGKGYWVIQMTGEAVTLDLPADSIDTPEGYSIPLSSRQSSPTQWNLLGYPFSSSGKLGDFSVQSTGGVCNTPVCDINQAKAERLFHNQVWAWGNGAYSTIDYNDSLAPWEGFWAATLENSFGQSLVLKHNTTPKHFAVGYLGPWYMTPDDIKNIDSLYTHVILSFARPGLTYDGENWVGKNTTGIIVKNPNKLDEYKKAIASLQARGVKVLLGVGGGEYSEDSNAWAKLADEESNAIQKEYLRELIKDLNLDGIDIDYERVIHSDINSELIDEYYNIILVLRDVVGDKKLLTMAAGSMGAECSQLMVDDGVLGCAEKSLFGHRVGLERLVFNKLVQNGYKVEDIFNHISIMTYAGFSKSYDTAMFDPVLLYKNYRTIYSGPLAIGLNSAPEGWGEAELVTLNKEAKECDSTSMIDAYTELDAYGNREGPKKPYSLERFIDFIGSQDRSGIMVWSLSKIDSEPGAPKCPHAVNLEGLNKYINSHLGDL